MATIRALRKTKTVAAVDQAPRRKGGLPPKGAFTKMGDSKGRVVLGGRFANRPVIIEKLSETELIVKLARVIPESEAWLYENPAALAAIRAGLADARAGRLTEGPDLKLDAKLAAELEG
jgi:hypothetical protein